MSQHVAPEAPNRVQTQPGDHQSDGQPGDIIDAAECIRIRGARMHNLQNLDLDIPRDRFVVITGPSGSGKSSLAFDTLYAEGQRQYIESLSVYARQFLHQLERPDVDLIEGLQPTISIDQRAGSHNPRSTVATVTEIYDYLRLLFARLGEPRCYQCGEPIRQQTPEQILDALLELTAGTRVMILAPLVRGRKGEHKDVFEAIRKAGLRPRPGRRPGGRRGRAAGAGRAEDAQHRGGDRPRRGPRGRPRAASPSRSIWRSSTATGWCWPRTRRRRPAAACGTTGSSAPSTPAPTARSATRSWSRGPSASTAPTGRVRRARGWARAWRSIRSWSCPTRSLSLAAGAIAPWKGDTPAAVRKHQSHLRPFLAKAGIRWNTPLEKLTPKLREQLLHGDGKQFRRRAGDAGKGVRRHEPAKTKPGERLEAFRGAGGVPRVRRRAAAARGPARARRRPGDSRGHGADRRPGAGVLRGPGISAEDQTPIAEPIVGEIRGRLEFLDQRGPGAISRSTGRPTRLSGGELQRVRLAAGLGSGLVGVCYVLDEPSIGLHPRDNQRLIDALRDLQARGNTVVVVEHDEAIMRRADWLIDLGPGAGRHGGRVVAQGTPERGRRQSRLAHRPLPGRRASRFPCPQRRRRVAKTRAITHRRRDDQQSQERHRAVSALGAGVRDRRERIGQELAVERDAGPGAGAPAGRRSPPSPARTPASAASARSTRWCRSTSRPSAARRGAIRPRTPACSTRSARCSPTPATPGSAATRRAASASTSRAAAARSARARGSGGSR